MTTTLIAASVILLGGFQSAAPLRQGAGDLLIAPTRIVFEGPKRTAEINLLNTGDKPATYRITFIHERMNEDGKLDEIVSPSPDDKFADELVRFTPRQVTLEPHVAQIVRVQMRLPASLDDGEYRSHMLFRAVSAPDAPVLSAAPGAPAKGIDIKLIPIYGLSIPVIVRHGAMKSTSELSDVRVMKTSEGAPVLVGKITRSGNASVYGDVWVEFAPKGGKFKTLARANGIALYASNSARNFAVLLSQDRTAPLESGTIQVTYRRQEADGGQVIAKSTIELP